MSNARKEKIETRVRIMQEMLRHVRLFGGKRTRLVALAEDLGMSHANIYRHFKNKTAIMDALVIEWLAEADAVIDASVGGNAVPKSRAISIACRLNQFLREKLDSEPAAIEVFRHAFSDHSEGVAEHLTGLKMKIANCVLAHLRDQGRPAEDLPLIMSVLTTVLEPYLNPVLVHDRDAQNDQEQLGLLMDRLLD